LGAADYVVATHNRQKIRRVCHVNLFKPYLERDIQLFPPPNVSNVGDVETDIQTDTEEKDYLEDQNTS